MSIRVEMDVIWCMEYSERSTDVMAKFSILSEDCGVLCV